MIKMQKTAKWFTMTVILISLMGCASMAWKDALKANNIAAYEDFLQQYPQSEFKKEASKKLETLYFDKAKATGTIAAYEDFLRRYPRSEFKKEASQKLETLYFDKAKATGTIAAYEDFLRRYPQSEFKKKVFQWLKNQEVHSVPDSHLLVKLLGRQDLTQIEVATGEMMFGQRERFTPVKKFLKPTAGHRFLVLRLEVTNLGPATSIQRQKLQLISKSGGSYTAVSWLQDLGLVAVRGESFDLKNSIRINVTFDVPKDDSLVLSVDGKSVASPSEFQQK